VQSNRYTIAFKVLNLIYIYIYIYIYICIYIIFLINLCIVHSVYQYLCVYIHDNCVDEYNSALHYYSVFFQMRSFEGIYDRGS